MCALIGEVSQAVSLAVVTTNCEKSAESVVVKKSLLLDYSNIAGKLYGII